MRKLIVTVAVLAVAMAAGMYWARPLLALRELKHALQSRDEDRVALLVDFDSLRDNVTHHTEQKIDQANDDKFLGSLRGSVEKVIADGKVENLATPAGLIHVACDRTPDGGVDTSPQPQSKPCVLNGKLQDAHYLSGSSFQASVMRPTGGLGLTLAKESGDWKLVDLTDSRPAS